jgi:hypothetical protein
MRKLSPVKAITHALNSVVTYRSAGLRIGMFWIPVMLVLNLVELQFGAPDPRSMQFGWPMAFQLFSAVVGLVGFSSIAVSWHRFILRDEVGSPARLDGTVLRYAGNSLLIGLVVAVPMVLGLVAAVLAPAAAVILVPVLLAVGTVVIRLSVKLPAVALERTDFGFRDAWQATAGSAWQILGVLLLNVAIIIGVVLLVALLLGALTAISVNAALAASLIVNAVASLFLALFNASIFTSLYGFFVERRNF